MLRSLVGSEMCIRDRPKTALYFLASIPILFVFYNGYCYLKATLIPRCLIVIAILNFIYSLISLCTAFFHYKTLTILGWIYLLIEIIVICTLAIFELKVASLLKQF